MRATVLAAVLVLSTSPFPGLPPAFAEQPAEVEPQMTPEAVKEVKVRQVEHLVGTTAVTPDGRELGPVRSLLLRPDGTVAGLVLEWGVAAGQGERLAALPWSEVKLSSSGRQVQLEADRTRLESASTYDPSLPATAGLGSDVVPQR